MNIDAARVLHIALQRAGVPANISGEFVLAESGLKIRGNISQHTQHPTAHLVVFSIQVQHSSAFPEGINDVAVGIGLTRQAAIENAANIWVEGTYIVIRAAVNDESSDSRVHQLEMAVKNLETGKLTSWRMYRGPVQASGIDVERMHQHDAENMNDEIMKVLLDELTGVLITERLVWVKCSISRLPDGNIQGDCWLNNDNWLPGLNKLYWLTESWPKSNVMQRRRQFFILKPVEEGGQVKNTEFGERAIPKKKWWEVWKL